MAAPGEGEGRPTFGCKEEILPCIDRSNLNPPCPPPLGLGRSSSQALEPALQPDPGLSKTGQYCRSCSHHGPGAEVGFTPQSLPGYSGRAGESQKCHLQKKPLSQSFSPKVAASTFYISVSLDLARRPQLVSGSSLLALAAPPWAIRLCSLSLPWAVSIGAGPVLGLHRHPTPITPGASSGSSSYLRSNK